MSLDNARVNQSLVSLILERGFFNSITDLHLSWKLNVLHGQQDHGQHHHGQHHHHDDDQAGELPRKEKVRFSDRCQLSTSRRHCFHHHHQTQHQTRNHDRIVNKLSLLAPQKSLLAPPIICHHHCHYQILSALAAGRIDKVKQWSKNTC